MHKYNKKNSIIALIIIVVAIAAIVFYKNSKLSLVNKDELNQCISNLTTASEKFKSNDDFQKYLIDYAKKNKLNYVKDRSGNIIISVSASSGKESLPRTVVCTSYNYRIAEQSIHSIASAQCIAKTASVTGPLSVIFLNNDANKNLGAKNISRSYFPAKSKVIYIDSGEENYISNSSYASQTSTVSIPYSDTPTTCDTEIKLKFSGIKTNIPNSDISAQPNPIMTLGSFLTYLKGKAFPFQLAQITDPSNGNMYPTDLEATILVNSYNLEDVQSYLDERIKKYKKEYKDDFPDIDYSYTVVTNKKQFPSKAYSAATTEALTNFLYTVNNGTYRFEENDVPAGSKEGDLYGINCIENVSVKGKQLIVTVNASAETDTYASQISNDNSTAASFSGATFKKNETVNAFTNANPSFSTLLSSIYSKVNNVTNKDINIKDGEDLYATPCSYFDSKNKNLDIVHICMADDYSSKVTNTILNFLTTNGTGIYSRKIKFFIQN